MCLIVLHWQPDARKRLIISANRDERYERKTQPMAEWQDYPHLIAGKDLEQGGTWLGVTHSGRLAALTNIRTGQPSVTSALSRGFLPLGFLNSDLNAERFLDDLAINADHYQPFNLLCFDGQQLWHACNHPHYSKTEVVPGFHTLSNALLDSPWPKSTLAEQQLKQWVKETQDNETSAEELCRLLACGQTCPDDELPDTGIPKGWEKILSSQFIRTPTYGTRSSTGIIVQSDTMDIAETSWNTLGEASSRSRYVIKIRKTL